MSFIKKCTFAVSLLPWTTAFAEPAYVYCANKNYKWEWLKENNKKVTVEGQWDTLIFNINVYIKYLRVDGGQAKIEELSQQCVKQYGEQYYIPQPAHSIFSEWYSFGTNSHLFNGLFHIQTYNFSYDFSMEFSNREIFPFEHERYLDFSLVNFRIIQIVSSGK